ncbi:MAG TPA: VOC family protein [Baekduia sp.]|jgi:PhnB protein
MTNPIPSGFHTLTPALVTDGAAAAIDFYVRAFGAEVKLRLDAGETVAHAELRIGDSLLTLCDPMPDYGLVAPDREGPVTSSLMLYCEDVDAVHARAMAEGATLITEVSDQFHGNRGGAVRDPFGHRWVIATCIEDVDGAEMQRRLDASMGANA